MLGEFITAATAPSVSSHSSRGVFHYLSWFKELQWRASLNACFLCSQRTAAATNTLLLKSYRRRLPPLVSTLIQRAARVSELQVCNVCFNAHTRTHTHAQRSSWKWSCTSHNWLKYSVLLWSTEKFGRHCVVLCKRLNFCGVCRGMKQTVWVKIFCFLSGYYIYCNCPKPISLRGHISHISRSICIFWGFVSFCLTRLLSDLHFPHLTSGKDFILETERAWLQYTVLFRTSCIT